VSREVPRIDALSEQPENLSPESGVSSMENRRSAPRWLVLVGVGLLLLAAAFAAWLVARGAVDATEQKTLPAPLTENEAALERLTERVEQLAGQVEKLSAGFVPMQAHISDLGAALGALEDKVGTAPDAAAAVTGRVEEIEQAAKMRFLRLEADIEQLGKTQRVRLGALASDLKAIRQRLTTPSRAISTADEALPEPTLPFYLISVDRWGAEPSASVSLDGHAHFLSVDDALAGWRVTAIDAAGGRLSVERDGTALTLEAQR
jgi:cell division protein FtsB